MSISGQSRSKPNGHRLLDITALALAIVVVRVTVSLAAETSLAQGALQYLQTLNQRRSDPTIGSTVLLDIPVALGTRKRATMAGQPRGVLLCMISKGCTCKARGYLQALRDFQTQHKEIQCRVIAPSRGGIEQLAEDERTAVTYHWDAGEVLGKQLNSFFAPRIYFFEQNRLLYIQPSQAPPDEVIDDVTRMLKKGGGRLNAP